MKLWKETFQRNKGNMKRMALVNVEVQKDGDKES